MTSLIDVININNKITDKLSEVNPDIYKKLVNQYNDHMFRLIDKGPMTMVWKLNG